MLPALPPLQSECLSEQVERRQQPARLALRTLPALPPLQSECLSEQVDRRQQPAPLALRTLLALPPLQSGCLSEREVLLFLPLDAMPDRAS